MSERMASLATVGLATAVFLGGSVLEAPSIDNTVPAVSVEYNGTLPGELYVGDMSLPDNIGQVEASTVEITTPKEAIDFSDTHGKHVGRRVIGSEGSGTVINYKGSKVVITAAHVVAPDTNHCADESVSIPANQQPPFSLSAWAQTPIEPSKGYDVPTYNRGRDAAVIVPKADTRLDKIPTMEVQDSLRIGRGDSIYSVGYGPRADRDPNPVDQNPGNQRPIVVPGEVLNVEGGKVDFLTNLNPTDDPQDYNSIHPGDSGGTLVDAEGNYIGDVIATLGKGQGFGTVFTGREIEAKYGLTLPKAAEGRYFGIAIGQLVDTWALEQMVGGSKQCVSGLPTHVKRVPVGTDISKLP